MHCIVWTMHLLFSIVVPSGYQMPFRDLPIISTNFNTKFLACHDYVAGSHMEVGIKRRQPGVWFFRGVLQTRIHTHVIEKRVTDATNIKLKLSHTHTHTLGKQKTCVANSSSDMELSLSSSSVRSQASMRATTTSGVAVGDCTSTLSPCALPA